MTYIPQVDDYVRWNRPGMPDHVDEGWVYFKGDEFLVSDAMASKDSMKTLHKTIKKVSEDIENFSFNKRIGSSGVVKSQFGFHVIQVLGRREGNNKKIATLSVASKKDVNAAVSAAKKAQTVISGDKLSQDEVAKGLKEALVLGATNSIKNASCP